MAVPPTLVAEYFSAIGSNDIDMVRELLDGCDGEHAVDINSVASDGSTALQVALELKYYELADTLINRRIKGGLTLLRMVEEDNSKAVEYLCKKYDTFKDYREDIFSSRTSDDEFPPETTAVTLAARLNRYEILKILLQYGAQMPSLEDVRRQFSSKRPGRERAVIQLCEALTSEAYLLQTSPDLLRDIFRLTEKLQEIRIEEKNSLEKLGSQDEYTVIEKRLHKMAENVLNFTNAEEVDSMLQGSDQEIPASRMSGCCGRGHSPNLSIRIAQALQMKFKEFIAHNKLQEYLWRHWRHGFSQHIDRSSARRIFMTTLLAICWPIFSVLYLVLSAFTNRCESFVRMMKTPYVKFILHASSRLTFLLIIILRVYTKQPAVFTVDEAVTKEVAVVHEYIHYKSHAYTLPGLIFIFIAGVTWREVTELRDQGTRMYVDMGSGFVDMPQIVLYWIYLVFAAVASVQVKRTIHQEDWLQQLASTMSLKKMCDPASSGSSNCTTLEESRLDWYAYEPLLIAEAAFAVANVFTFVRLLDITVLIAGLGALQVSFKKMFYPIGKFLSLFAFVWLSFSLGMTQLYRSFEDAMLELCRENTSECPDVHFTNLWVSLKTFFWMLFGIGGLDFFDLPSNLHMSENIGYLVFALWHIAVVMFLMKILIGLTSAVYGKIQENADTEWKFARTKMVSEYMMDTAVVPPPFNLIPSTASVVGCFKAIVRTINKDTTETEDMELARTRRAKTIRLEERQQSKAIKLTQNYKMISGMVKRRYARSVMKSQHKFSSSNDSQEPRKSPSDRSHTPGGIKPEIAEEFLRLQKKCDTLSSDMKTLQETIDNLVDTLKPDR